MVVLLCVPVRHAVRAGTEAETTEECGLAFWHLLHAYLAAVLSSPGPPAQGWRCPPGAGPLTAVADQENAHSPV